MGVSGGADAYSAAPIPAFPLKGKVKNSAALGGSRFYQRL